MDGTDYFSYSLTLIAITLAPGSVVLMLMVRAATNDTRGALGFGVGYAKSAGWLVPTLGSQLQRTTAFGMAASR